jgi:hypothetical protein
MSIFSQNALHQVHRFGNLSATSTTEVLISARAYVEQASQAQRSVKSTSAQDNPAGTGSAKVRISYLDSNYVLKSEDITLNGTTAVNTVATDIRFIESFFVIQGAAAVGAIEIWTAINGGGSAFCGIGTATTDAFLCHHYVPAGKTDYITGWGTTVDDESSMKLNATAIYDGTNRVPVILDLYKLFASNPTPPTRIEFYNAFDEDRDAPLVVTEKNRIWVTVVPNQATSTVIRGYLDVWEE